MPRHRTIPRPDTDQILLRIANQSELEREHWLTKVMPGYAPDRTDGPAQRARLTMAQLGTGWIAYDLETFSGRESRRSRRVSGNYGGRRSSNSNPPTALKFGDSGQPKSA